MEKLSRPKLLYIDILNYGLDFFTKDWNMNLSLRRVQKFQEAATNSGIQLKVFLDDTANSKEALKKWKSRREREIRHEEKRVPQVSHPYVLCRTYFDIYHCFFLKRGFLSY